MEKKCKVILLSDNKANGILSYKYIGDKELQFGKYKDLSSYYNPQHLYILSDDEIKDLEYCYHPLDKDITKLDRKIHIALREDIRGYGFKKIIATTNPDLIKEGIALIDDKFIKEYCSNPVEDVSVEYEVDLDLQGALDEEESKIDAGGSNFIEYKPKLSRNSSILIKPVEETWNDIFKKLPPGLRIHDLKWLQENYKVPKKK